MEDTKQKNVSFSYKFLTSKSAAKKFFYVWVPILRMHVHMGDIIYIHVNTVTLSIDLQAVLMTGNAAKHLQGQEKG